MSAGSCVRERAVVAAAREGSWSEDLRAHVAVCPVCADAALVSEMLLAEARAPEETRPLPDPGRVWVDAQLRARRLAAQRAARPITIAQRVAAVCGAAVAIGAAARFAPFLGPWLSRLRASSPDPVSSFAFYNGILIAVMSGAFLILAVYAVLTSLRES
jgi:hypothetical protein